MKSRNEDAIVDLLTETVMRWVDHQEGELGKPVMKREYFWGIARHFINTLVAFAAAEHDPQHVVEIVIRQVHDRALFLLEGFQNPENAFDDEDEESDEDDDLP
jgi:hypothetical protein